jgi:SAM-dependent methyltransferase
VQRDDWDRHWQEYARSAESNPAQRWRRRLVFDLLDLAGAPPPVRVLDVGSGQGDFAADLRAHAPHAEILGLELSASGVEIARRKVAGAAFVQRDLLDAGAPDPAHRAWATHAVCTEVLEHVDDPVRFCANVRSYLAPGGRLVVTVPGGPVSQFDRHIGHRRHFRVREVRDVLAAAGFTVERATGAGFPFFNLYRLVVLARGKRLIADVRTQDGPPGGAAGLAMRAFDHLFRWNLGSSPLGWQIVATARTP